METKEATQANEEGKPISDETERALAAKSIRYDVMSLTEMYALVNEIVTRNGDYILNYGARPKEALKAILSALENMEAKLGKV